MTISMLKIRRPLGRLIFNMGIAIPGKTVFLIETAPRSPEPQIVRCRSQCDYMGAKKFRETNFKGVASTRTNTNHQ